MKIMITGATGYIGHKLALEAASRNHTVHILVRNLQSLQIPKHPNIIAFNGDITDKESVMKAMQGCKAVMHSAAVAKLWDKDSSIFYKVNVEGARNVLDAALALGVSKFIYTSTGGVIGPSDKMPMNEDDPRITAFENEYEISKYWAEELVKEYGRRGLFTVIVAASRVYGPGIVTGGNVFEKLLTKIFSMRIAFVPPCGEVQANYAYIDDVVAGHFLAMEKGLCGEKYILGGENISYHTFFSAIKKFSVKKIKLVKVPGFLLLTWSFFHMIICRLIGQHTNISPKFVHRVTQNRALSCDKAIRQLGYTITPFSEGIQKTILHISDRSKEVSKGLIDIPRNPSEGPFVIKNNNYA
jgi:nucleoside-diphosphate-sugar epimerase